jgi:hypothetical protein
VMIEKMHFEKGRDTGNVLVMDLAGQVQSQ